jgi:hypothetical protein
VHHEDEADRRRALGEFRQQTKQGLASQMRHTKERGIAAAA